MKKQITLALFLFFFIKGSPQSVSSFKSLRYDEDYTFLRNDTGKSWYSKMKYAPISKNGSNYISIGGETRYQYFYIKNEDWGEAVKDKDGYIFTRYLAHADFHIGKSFRTFVQLQSSLANGKASGTSAVDENPLDLHQAFIDIASDAYKKYKLTFRIGRQELMYGSQRLVAVRDFPNNRQSFDAAKIILAAKNNKLDIFYSHYAVAKKNVFDDNFNKNNKLWGAYFVRNNIYFLRNAELYYFGLWRKMSLFDDAQGKELRHSIGSRIWAKDKTWGYDFEMVYQFGKTGYKSISAYTLSSNTSFKLKNLALKPEIGLKTEVISGDTKSNDEKLGTFNPLFPRGAYFGLAALIGPSNLFDLHPSISFEFSKHLTWNVDYDAFWRYSSNDGIYAPNVSLIYSGKSTTNKFIGQQYATDLNYTFNNFLSLRAEFTWFKSERFLKNAGTGKDILFAGFTTQLKY